MIARKRPTSRRAFVNDWAELDYLCKKIHYWLYRRKSKRNAGYYLERLEQVLTAQPHDDKAILRQDALALLCELKGKTGDAVSHRKKEILLMEQLHAEARSPRYDSDTRAYLLRDRDSAALKRRRQILNRLLGSNM